MEEFEEWKLKWTCYECESQSNRWMLTFFRGWHAEVSLNFNGNQYSEWVLKSALWWGAVLFYYHLLAFYPFCQLYLLLFHVFHRLTWCNRQQGAMHAETSLQKYAGRKNALLQEKGPKLPYANATLNHIACVRHWRFADGWFVWSKHESRCCFAYLPPPRHENHRW